MIWLNIIDDFILKALRPFGYLHHTGDILNTLITKGRV